MSSVGWTDPAQTERYRCHAEQVATDEYFTGFRLASPSPVQTEVYVSVSATAAQTGDFNCSFGALTGTEAIYAAGPGTTQLTFPGGKGVHVAAGAYVLLVTHLINTGDASVTDSTVIEGRVAKAADVTTPVDLTFSGTYQISIPSDDAPHRFTGGCNAAADFHIFAALPLMRTLGTHLTSAAVANGDSVPQIFHDVTFDPQHVLYTTLSSDILLLSNSHLTTTCTYVNNTGTVVASGSSSGQETCFDGLYRYPPKPPTITSPFECVNNQSI